MARSGLRSHGCLGVHDRSLPGTRSDTSQHGRGLGRTWACWWETPAEAVGVVSGVGLVCPILPHRLELTWVGLGLRLGPCRGQLQGQGPSGLPGSACGRDRGSDGLGRPCRRVPLCRRLLEPVGRGWPICQNVLPPVLGDLRRCLPRTPAPVLSLTLSLSWSPRGPVLRVMGGLPVHRSLHRPPRSERWTKWGVPSGGPPADQLSSLDSLIASRVRLSH